MRRRLAAVAPFAAAGLCVWGYHALGEDYYRGYHVPQGVGMASLTVEELACAALFALFGAAVLVLVTAGLLRTGAPERLAAAARRLALRPSLVVAGAAFAALAGALLFGRLVLGGAPTSDDENTYRFIGQTLARGALVAPSPGGDLAFYQEQFVALSETARFGKYPIGFPALLALGRLAGGEALVVPLLTALLVLLVARVGREVYDARTAALAAVLLAASPQVLATGGTWVSQPASAVCVMAALACLLAIERANGARRAAWAAAAGAALGYGVLVRPLPGVLFVGVALVYMVLAHRPRRLAAGELAPWAALLAPLAVFAALMLLVNRSQTGDALTTGYEAAHRTPMSSLLGRTPGLIAASLGGALLRLDHWFLGWPFALALPLLSRWSPRVRLLVGVVAAELAYRVIAPKAGVGTTGPIYMYEALPALALLAADGVLQVAGGAGRLGAVIPGRRLAPSLLAAGALVAVLLFLPPRVGDLAIAGAAHRTVDELVARRGASRALVFHETIVPAGSGLSWAYHPRHNGPALDDDVLFVNFWRERPEENRKFWKRRHPDRQAFYFGYEAGRPVLVALDEYIGKIGKVSGGRP